MTRAVKARALQEQILDGDQKNSWWVTPPPTRSCRISATWRAPGDARRYRRSPITPCARIAFDQALGRHARSESLPSMRRRRDAWRGRPCLPANLPQGAPPMRRHSRLPEVHGLVRRAAIVAVLPLPRVVRWLSQSPLAVLAQGATHRPDPSGRDHRRCGPIRRRKFPPVRLANSGGFGGPCACGRLYLTVRMPSPWHSRIISISRSRAITRWFRHGTLERAEAGGALPGVPAEQRIAGGSVAVGQGVAGSQAAAGVSITGASANKAQSGNAAISQVGPVTQNLDPSIQETTTFSHTSIPQPNAVQSITPVLVSGTRVYSGAYTQGFLTGGAVSVNYSEHYLSENAPTESVESFRGSQSLHVRSTESAARLWHRRERANHHSGQDRTAVRRISTSRRA